MSSLFLFLTTLSIQTATHSSSVILRSLLLWFNSFIPKRSSPSSSYWLISYFVQSSIQSLIFSTVIQPYFRVKISRTFFVVWSSLYSRTGIICSPMYFERPLMSLFVLRLSTRSAYLTYSGISSKMSNQVCNCLENVSKVRYQVKCWDFGRFC